MSPGSDPAVVQVAIAGALGRMGQAVAAAIQARPGVELAGLFDRPDTAQDSADMRDVALERAQVVVDFTTAQASVELGRTCAARGGPALVIGSTGFDAEGEAAVRAAAEHIAIVKSGNFSLGVNVLVGLVRQAARALGRDAYDIEILEAHHRRKLDAPSGTALMLGQAAAEARGEALHDVSVQARQGLIGPRAEGAIGLSVMRGGGIVGEHSVLFAAEDELLTLSHSARDRSLFARGAVEAAVWAAQRPPGLYDMQDVLGLARA